MLGAWLFLPMASYNLSGLPDITKMSVTCVTVFFATALFDPARFGLVRFHWADLAVLLWLAAPIPSAVVSGFGIYEGVSGLVQQSVAWGLPYFIGRLYFADAASLRELAFAIVVAGIVYVPFVLFEAKMSPQLHKMVYGYFQHYFGQTKRMGGWRPMVFMQHGLAVALFMGTAALCAFWLWWCGRVRVLFRVPMWVWVAGLIGVTLLCRSAYAMLLLAFGIGVLFVSQRMNTRALLLLCLGGPLMYIGLRTVGGWDADVLRRAAEVIGQDRRGSLGLRLESEDALWHWVRSDLLFGKGRLTDLINAPKEVYGRFVPDGLWVIALGKYGVVGLLSLFGVLLLPAFAFVLRAPRAFLRMPHVAGAAALVMVLLLYAMDNLLNAMVNPIYLLAAGGLAVAGVRTPRGIVGPRPGPGEAVSAQAS